jgi:hypothetical protein
MLFLQLKADVAVVNKVSSISMHPTADFQMSPPDFEIKLLLGNHQSQLVIMQPGSTLARRQHSA